MSVISFSKAKEAREPHLTGNAVCLQCKHKWVAVVPDREREIAAGFECPSCGTNKGVFSEFIIPPPGVSLWVCDCGNEYMFACDNGHVLCPKCGAWSER